MGSYYSKIEEPCFVCEVEDKLNEERGTQSHPINCGWRVKREKAGYEAGLREIMKLSREKGDLSKEEYLSKMHEIALSTLFARYDIKKKEDVK